MSYYPAKILAVDDEPNMLRVFRLHLEKEGYRITTVETGKSALDKLRNEPYDVVLADLTLEDVNGIELLKEAKRLYSDIGFIIVTGKGTIDDAVQAMRNGADDFISKPVKRDQLLLSLSATLERHSLMKGLYSAEETGDFSKGENIIGSSKVMQELFDTSKKVANSEATILIQGESGSGKELLARAIHHNSPRKDHPLVVVDCASLPLELLQSELFGHIKGSFTGAVKDRRGLFEEARGGSIFLDEIGEIPEPLQLSLLRVLQEKEIRPVGSDQTVKVDVRLISATNRKLKEEVENGHFRRDLYYRLSVIILNIPPLRERLEDIPLLTHYFLKKFNRQNHKKVNKISPEALNLMLSYWWEGNVRELENVIERAVVLAEDDMMTAKLLPAEFFAGGSSGLAPSPLSLSEFAEKRAIMEALRSTQGNKSQSAKILGFSRPTLDQKIQQYGIDMNKKSS
jgi:DNA-binding NtrC family response regulator